MKSKRQPDPRHTEVKAVLVKYWAAENPDGPDMPWGPADAGALGTFLKASPTLTVEQIKQLLRNRFSSDDHTAGEPVFVWIKYLTRYLRGPLNKFKQLKETKHGEPKPNRADASVGHASSSTAAALARIRGVARD